MSKPDIEKVSLRMESIWMEAENRVIEDIVRRIRKEGKITSTADYQINRVIQMGKSSEEVEKILKEALDATYPQMFKLYDDIAEWEYVRNKDIYEQVNGRFIPPEDNEWLIQISEAVKEQTADELKNLSQSYGFSIMMENRRVFMPFSTYYQKYVDAGIMDVISGNSDYNTVLRRIVTQMTNSGLRTVDYASGWSNRTPVAVRRAVMSGVSQITGKVNERNAALLGTDTFEVSWHSGARPEHRVWQGRWYTYDKLISVCGLGSVTGLCGANCYHEYYPVIPGISERQYSDEWLAEQNRKEEQTQEWHGKQLDAYGITQEQRKMETAMRAQRSKIAALKKGDYDPDQLTLEKAKYQGQLYEYTVFSKKMGIPQQRERIYMDGLGRLATNTSKENAKYSSEMIKNATRDLNQYNRYKNIVGNSVGTLADFRQMKYNKLEEFDLLNDYANSVKSGMISPLSGFKNYKKLHTKIQKDIIGMTTSTGIKISGQSKHFMERVIGTKEDPKTHRPRSGVSVEEIKDALLNGNPRSRERDPNSIKYVTNQCIVSVNPNTGILIQCNPQ